MIDLDTKSFEGVYPALFTPYDKTGRVDQAIIEALVQFHLEAGVTGFYTTGMTGESLLLGP